ncbi:hypothetical protein P7M03_26880, partial [Vibrio parahaemolyticus]|nr:hypothetical protein [Vibrio parahaemolyticus]
ELSFVSNQPRIYKVEKYQTKNSFSMCIKVCVVKSLVRTLRTLLKFLSVFKRRRKPTTNYLGVLSNDSK